MFKAELVAQVAQRMLEEHEIAPKDTELVVDAFLQSMVESLVQDGEVKLSRFGTFEIRNHKAKMRRNPRTKEPFLQPPSQTIGFRCSPIMKALVLERRKNDQD